MAGREHRDTRGPSPRLGRGRALIEEAFDYYAQGDDGGVWYFGEDVDNYTDGELADHDGAWLAGQDSALPALLMPGAPEVGQVFYSEDIPSADTVERDEILSLSEPADTPEGPVTNGLLLGATQPDGTEEEKVFVPELGEVLARSGEGEVRLTARLPDGAESAAAATFSDPTTVDNPWFGVTGVDYRLSFGEDEGEPIRIEVALPTGQTETIEWEGGSTDAVVSRFLETSDGDLLEIAVDWFAQDDGGNVWYFGEDVANYADGRVDNTDGSWVAGQDGPPGLIMPAAPALGQRFNPENIPGVVFETVDVQALDETYTLATDETVDGVLQLHETLDDGVEETKLYARGYGNVNVEIPGVETVDLVYALPNDAITAPLPAELDAALEGLRAVDGVDGAAVRRALESDAGTADPVPVPLLDLAAEQLDVLDASPEAAHALEVTVLDLAHLYETGRPVDLDLLDLQARRMLAAVEAGDRAAAGVAAAVAGEVVARSATVDAAVGEALVAAGAAVDGGDLDALAAAAQQLRSALS